MVKSDNSKCRYLFVEAKNVVSYPSTTWKRYDKCDRPFITLEEIYEYYDIPEKYRYFIVKMNSLLSRFECQEYFTKVPFDYTGYTRFKKNDNNRIIRGRAILSNKSNIVEFQTPMVYEDYDTVVEFAFGIIDDVILERYKSIISQIFNINFDCNNLSELNKYRLVRKK